MRREVEQLYTPTPQTHIHEDTASVHPQPYPRQSRGSQAQSGLPWRPVFCALFPLCTVSRWLPPLNSRDHDTHIHMHHKCFHVYTYTRTHMVYYQASQQSCNYCPVDSTFLYKVKEWIVHLNLYMSVNKLFLDYFLDLCLFINRTL